MRIKPGTVLLMLALVTFAPGAARPVRAAPKAVGAVTGIVGITSETKVILSRMTGRRASFVEGIPFVTGRLGGARVVVARCGVGKVNSAMAATLLIDHFHLAAVLFSGSAGALNPDLAPGDVVIGARTVQHDAGTVTDRGMQHEAIFGATRHAPLFFDADPRMLAAARASVAGVALESVAVDSGMRRPRVIVGVIATGDVFVADQKLNDAIRRDLGADAVEEEGAAVAQVCWQMRVPYLAIRSVSDNANGQTPTNYARFYGYASENSARLVTDIVARLARTRPAPPRPALTKTAGP